MDSNNNNRVEEFLGSHNGSKESLMTKEIPTPPRVRRIFAILSFSSLALAGILAAFTIISGIGDTWQASMTSFVLFGLNMLVLISLLSAHRWLKVAQWIMIPIVGVFSFYFTWVHDPLTWDEKCTYNEVTFNETCVRSNHDLLQDWGLSLWFIMGTLSLLSFFTWVWKYINDKMFFKIVYAIVFVLLITASIITWISIGVNDNGEEIIPIVSAMWVLASTGAAIVIIYAAVTKTTRRKEEAKQREIEKSIILNSQTLRKNGLQSTVDYSSEAFKNAVRLEVESILKERGL